MHQPSYSSRRRFLLAGTAAGGTAALAFGASPLVAAEPEKKPENEKTEVSAIEDLMREHGVLRRVLLVYGEAARRLQSGGALPDDLLPTAAGMVRRFVEDYHEKLEEDHLFPMFEKMRTMQDLVKVLRDQHLAGRRLTAEIISLSTGGLPKDEAGRRKLADRLGAFIRMYQPHAAREDTVLFPALHEMLTAKQYDALGDQFEDKERELFGAEGFEKMVAAVAALERAVEIHDLAKFTP